MSLKVGVRLHFVDQVARGVDIARTFDKAGHFLVPLSVERMFDVELAAEYAGMSIG
ncbi:hypothetical protein ACSMXN_14475 [Jatrophihabitans sp. DSM 45814]